MSWSVFVLELANELRGRGRLRRASCCSGRLCERAREDDLLHAVHSSATSGIRSSRPASARSSPSFVRLPAEHERRRRRRVLLHERRPLRVVAVRAKLMSPWRPRRNHRATLVEDDQLPHSNLAPVQAATGGCDEPAGIAIACRSADAAGRAPWHGGGQRPSFLLLPVSEPGSFTVATSPAWSDGHNPPAVLSLSAAPTISTLYSPCAPPSRLVAPFADRMRTKSIRWSCCDGPSRFDAWQQVKPRDRCECGDDAHTSVNPAAIRLP